MKHNKEQKPNDQETREFQEAIAVLADYAKNIRLSISFDCKEMLSRMEHALQGLLMERQRVMDMIRVIREFRSKNDLN